MDDTSDATRQPTSLDKVLGALAALGEATAASISEHAGIGYSTTTPKLRELESDGRAERFRAKTGRILWRLTTPGADQPGGDATEQPTRTDGEPMTDHPPAPTQTAGPGETAGPDSDPGDGESDGSPPFPAPHTAEANPAAKSGAGASRPASASASAGHPEPPARAAASANAGEAAAADGGKGRRGSAIPKRRKGALRDAVLVLLQANPDTAYKVGEICRLVDQATEGADVNKASAGAVANALDKLVVDGTVRQVGDKPATFQAA